jgi:hypothetical protein
MQTVRAPAVAGQFYPADPAQLHTQLQQFLSQVEAPTEPPPKAIIVPHAGYIYSGPVAATAYARLKAARDLITRVVLLGPSHRVGFRGIAISTMTAFATPLGQIPLDQAALELVQSLPEVGFLEQAHTQEHSLEVHLPFLQEVLGEFQLVPLVVGEAKPPEVGAVLEALWGGPETLIVDSPITFTAAGSPTWSPHNYDMKFEGTITVQHAVEESRNIPAIKTLQAIGVEKGIEYARKLGLKDDLPPYLPIAIGAGEATLDEMACA